MSDFEAKVEEKIQERANTSNTSAQVDTGGVDRDVLFNVVSELREEGYVVKVGKDKMDIFWYEEDPIEVSNLI